MAAILDKRMRGRPRAPLKPPPGAVQSLDRGLRLVEIVAATDGIALTDLAHQAELPPSTAHRLLATLAARGFVEFAERDQHWVIGIEAFRVGVAFQRRTRIVRAGRRMMQDLMQASGETANLGILDGDEVVFLAQVESHEPVRAFFRVGERRAAHASGIGKALLAQMAADAVGRLVERQGLARFTDHTITHRARLLDELATIRHRGYAVDDEERNLGMRCIAAPIFDEFGDVFAGISISGPTARLSDERIRALGPRVVQTAAEITRAVGGLLPQTARES